jgi:uncharacterized protein YdiU (UPF0061 family)
MNTDNMSVLGLTMDYGPFQFLDAYDPKHICNHTDRGGRYAFDRQPAVANWNLYALAQALMPLIQDQALAVQALESFNPVFERTLHQLMCGKLGLTDPDSQTGQVQVLITDVLKLMAQDRVDYTIFWRRLSHSHATDNGEPVRDMFMNRPAFDTWMLRYKEHFTFDQKALASDLMLKTNPKYVLRNYLGEQAIQAAKGKNFTMVTDLLKVLEHPCEEHPEFDAWAGFPPDWAADIAISCSS